MSSKLEYPGAPVEQNIRFYKSIEMQPDPAVENGVVGA